MHGRRNPFIAREGIPFLLFTLVLCWFSWQYLGLPWLAGAVLLLLVLFLIFRDPRRLVPAVPLGVVSPVDGRVIAIDAAANGLFEGKGQRITIRINSFGTYTARSPVEGKVMDLNSLSAEAITIYRTNALWLQTDEGDDVVLQFSGYRFGLAPRSLMRYGERLGPGTRCAYLRLTRRAELHLPPDCKIQAEVGQRVTAGQDVLARLRSP
ncbi:MAG: hypothetical protein HKN77_06025 [Woeseiaceae bacterium]|nr:hypothetical protein [Woeseiaceae bacterium]